MSKTLTRCKEVETYTKNKVSIGLSILENYQLEKGKVGLISKR